MKTITTKTGQTLIVRPPQNEDLEVLYQYAKTIETEDTFITLNPNEPINLKEEESFLSNTIKQIKLKKKIQLLVFDQDKIVGASHVEKNGRRSGHIGTFGISLLQPYRSQGIGKKLMQFIISTAQKELNVSKITLSCMSSNQVALKLYRQLGFKKYGHLPQAYSYKQKHVDAVYLYKDLA